MLAHTFNPCSHISEFAFDFFFVAHHFFPLGFLSSLTLKDFFKAGGYYSMLSNMIVPKLKSAFFSKTFNHKH